MNIKIQKTENIKCEISVDPDKSITHRTVIIGSINNGKTIIKNYLKSEDTKATIKILKQSGVEIIESTDQLIINSNGFNSINPDSKIFNCKNSATTLRLLSGVFCSIDNIYVELTGDNSLKKRPMDRIIKPLKMMGAHIKGNGKKGFPPIKIAGKQLNGIKYSLEIPSAQVKSALIFAGLNANNETEIIETIYSRDHTERLLKLFNAKIKIIENNKKIIKILKSNLSSNLIIEIPGDFSSAAYFIALGILSNNSEILIKNVGINKTRTGFLSVLKKMGAKIQILDPKVISNEETGDIYVKGIQKLNGVKIEYKEIPSMIDEIPLIALIATQSNGTTIINGAEELRIKESDRLKAISSQLNKMGADIIEKKDGLIINGKTKLIGTAVNSFNDHRIALTLSIAGLIAEGETTIKNAECINVSFPSFYKILKECGCEVLQL